MELRRKLEQRMEYASKVKTLPHDPAMDPDESVPSYASSTEYAERVRSEAQYASMTHQHESSMDRVSQSMMLDEEEVMNSHH